MTLLERPRRNRKSSAIRSLVQETYLHPSKFVCPIFIHDRPGAEAIASMPGIERLSIDLALKLADRNLELGIGAAALFPVIAKEKKDPIGKEALNPDNLMARALAAFKKEFPQMCLIADIALDPYTDHGHDGLVNMQGEVLNDETVDKLSSMSLIMAGAGADIVAPSDMMDGRVLAIRRALDKGGFLQTSILSYAAKFASGYYGPFRDALGSCLQSGDKKSYQMNPANRREALRECRLDVAEGADMLLLKPAGPYLDVISEVKRTFDLPVGAYHVSGEYAMVMAAHERGWLDAEKVFEETLLGIRRAGADFILSYAAPLVARQLACR